jgi:hypothetical protein
VAILVFLNRSLLLRASSLPPSVVSEAFPYGTRFLVTVALSNSRVCFKCGTVKERSSALVSCFEIDAFLEYLIGFSVSPSSSSSRFVRLGRKCRSRPIVFPVLLSIVRVRRRLVCTRWLIK